MARSKAAQLESFCKRFQLPQKTCHELIQGKVAADELSQQWYKRPPQKNSEIYRTLSSFSNDSLLYLMAISKKNIINKSVSLFVTSLRNIRPLLNGDDLKKLGYTPGEKFKEILSSLRDAQLDGIVDSRKKARQFVKNNFPAEA